MNVNYWRGCPAPEARSNVTTVQLLYIASWPPRRDNFIACDLDVCAVPRAFMSELLDANGEPKYPAIKTIKNLVGLSLDGLFFTFTINPISNLIGNGQLPNGIPTNFFNNTHVRKAFAHAFNHARYVKEVYQGEAIWPSTPLVQGLFPDYRTGMPSYDVDFDLAEAELKNAIFNGKSLWETGFSFSMGSFGGSDVDYTWLNLQNFFATLSTYDGPPPAWPDFVINMVYVDWPTYLAEWENFELPLWVMGWRPDFSDADNFVRLYMHSNGDFSSFQNYTAVNGWGSRKDELVDTDAKTPESPTRAAMYAELEQIYINDCPNVPIAQPLNRWWTKYWVKGWYYNPLYPSACYYHLWKEDTCWADVTGVTEGVSDGVCDTRDIGYVAQRFGVEAPGSSKTPPYDPK